MTAGSKDDAADDDLEEQIMAMLKRLVLKGFKSIKEMDLELRSLNVLIGANGAGKSNLVSFFKMLSELAGGRLQNYVASAGRCAFTPLLRTEGNDSN